MKRGLTQGRYTGTITFDDTAVNTDSVTYVSLIGNAIDCVLPSVTVSALYSCAVNSQNFDSNTMAGSFVIKQDTTYSAVKLTYSNLEISNKTISNVNNNDIILYSDRRAHV